MGYYCIWCGSSVDDLDSLVIEARDRDWMEGFCAKSEVGVVMAVIVTSSIGSYQASILLTSGVTSCPGWLKFSRDF